MSDNLALWNAVEKTPPDQTKPITGKSYNGTSPKPHYLVRKATETFGPCGIGWGFTVDERIEDGAMIEPGHFEKMHVAKVTVWYEWQGKRGEVVHVGGTPFSGCRRPKQGETRGAPFTDEDAPKKSVTDALVKALSMIGFAGDIFMGRYDDSKYVSELQVEAREAAKPKPDPANATVVETMLEVIGGLTSRPAITDWQAKQNAEIEKLDEVSKTRVLAAARNRFRELPKEAA